MNEKNNLKNIFYQCGYYKIENFFSEEFIKELNLEIENAKNVKKYYDKNNKLRRIEKLYDKGKFLNELNDQILKYLTTTFKKV